MAKSSSFREEFNRSMRRRTINIEDRTEMSISNPIIKAEVPESKDIEIINAWELLGEDEQNNQGEGHANSGKNFTANHSRSFRTIEDFDAMQLEMKQENEKGLKRKAVAKELKALNISSSNFEFTREGSLKDWILLKGIEVCSPGSYVTPKFGNMVEQGVNNSTKDNKNTVFDPELVEQFENAMNELKEEEESIIQEIIDSLEVENENSK